MKFNKFCLHPKADVKYICEKCAREEIENLKFLLGEALYNLEEHNNEHDHRTPIDLINQIKEVLERGKKNV